MEKIYYSIAEVSELLSIAPPTLRYWEQEFTQLSPKRNAKGTRFYTQNDINIIKQIHFLRNEQKMTIDGVKQKLTHSKSDVEKIQQTVERLKKLRNDLQGIKNQIGN